MIETRVKDVADPFEDLGFHFVEVERYKLESFVDGFIFSDDMLNRALGLFCDYVDCIDQEFCIHFENSKIKCL
jgi:hypothetical protein